MIPLRYVNTTVGFRELPTEVSLLIELSNCGGHCRGCHSPYLKEDKGELIYQLYSHIASYKDHITAVCFLGHGLVAQKDEFVQVLKNLKYMFPKLTIGLYSGLNVMIPEFMEYLSYYKVGEYIQSFGGLDFATTNQKMYRLNNGSVTEEIKFYES